MSSPEATVIGNTEAPSLRAASEARSRGFFSDQASTYVQPSQWVTHSGLA